MKRAIVLSLLTVLVGSCKSDKPPETRPAETRPVETKPEERPAEPKPVEAVPAAGGLASIAIPNAKVADQVLVGGQPTDEHLQQAKDRGVKVVVNLRTKGEEKEYATEAAKVESLGMKYVHLPIDGYTGDGLNEESARKLAALLAEKPLLVHCTSGERVGALFALKAFYVDKLPADAALQVGKDKGITMPKVEKLVSDVLAKAKG